MTTALTADRTRAILVLAALSLAALLVGVRHAAGASVVEEERAQGDVPEHAHGSAVDERIVVDPAPGWPGHDAWREWSYPGAPRIRVGVDRGEWSTYEAGDRIAVYFQVDRPCYVTILDYTTDGRVEVLFPSGWSSSNYARPGETYRIPNSRRYALRVTGPAGVETIVACAHELSWPGGPPGAWVFPDIRWRDRWQAPPGHRGRRGAVVVEPSRPSRGRVVVEPRWWPVPPEWHDSPERWSCDEVSFYVADWYWDRGSWGVGDDRWDERPWHDDDWSEWHAFSEQFEMWHCSDEFSRQVRVRGDDARVSIRCTESRNGRPTEIVGLVSWVDDSEAETLFRIDADGTHGDVPRPGRVFEKRLGAFRVEVQILDVETSGRGSDGRRIEWIRFEVRAFPN